LSAEGPSSAPQAAEGPSSAPQAAEGPSSAPQAAEGPSSAPQAAEGPSSAPQAAEGPSSAPQAAEGPRSAPQSTSAPRSQHAPVAQRAEAILSASPSTSPTPDPTLGGSPAETLPSVGSTRPVERPDSQAAARAAAQPAPLRRAALQEWEGFVEALRETRPALSAVLEHGVPRVVSAERIVLSFQKNSFYGRQADAPAAREAIRQIAQARMGSEPKIEVRYDLDTGESNHSVAALEATRRDAKQKQRRREALGHPVVRDAIQVFSGSTGRVSVQLEGD
jgi:hypothetical protein